MVADFPSIQIWIDLNDPGVFTYVPIEEVLMNTYLFIFQEIRSLEIDAQNLVLGEWKIHTRVES